MATCKDCLHYQVCGFVMDMSDDEIEEPNEEKNCIFFVGDAALVVHGRWINRQNWSVTCSVCGSLGIAHDGKNYCPYCGAKMDGGKGK